MMNYSEPNPPLTNVVMKLIKSQRPSSVALVLVLACVAAVLHVRAGEFAISRHTMGGGGTSVSSDGRLSVSGTIGQPVSGLLVSDDGRYRLTGGFWQAEAGSRQPSLAVTMSNGALTVAWDARIVGYVLEFTEELRSPTSATVWQPLNPQPANGIYFAPALGNQRFFRLRSR